jgi:hypothetical protein
MLPGDAGSKPTERAPHPSTRVHTARGDPQGGRARGGSSPHPGRILHSPAAPDAPDAPAAPGAPAVVPGAGSRSRIACRWQSDIDCRRGIGTWRTGWQSDVDCRRGIGTSSTGCQGTSRCDVAVSRGVPIVAVTGGHADTGIRRQIGPDHHRAEPSEHGCARSSPRGGGPQVATSVCGDRSRARGVRPAPSVSGDPSRARRPDRRDPPHDPRAQTGVRSLIRWVMTFDTPSPCIEMP